MEENNKKAQEVTQTENKQKAKLKPLFSTRMLAGTAIFAALSYGVSFLEFSVFPASMVAFLKLDFSNVFIMLAGFMYGPISALFVGIIKELLCLIGTSTFGVGQIITALLVNKFITFPLYGMAEFFDGVVWLILAFNAIKSVSVSIITVLLYKRVGYVFEKIRIK